MNKEEILEKSRLANEDEGMEYVANEGRRIGYVAFLILYIFFVVFGTIFSKYNIYGAISSLFCMFLAGESYASYRFEKKKTYLTITIGFVISSLIAVAAYVINTVFE